MTNWVLRQENGASVQKLDVWNPKQSAQGTSPRCCSAFTVVDHAEQCQLSVIFASTERAHCSSFRRRVDLAERSFSGTTKLRRHPKHSLQAMFPKMCRCSRKVSKQGQNVEWKRANSAELRARVSNREAFAAMCERTVLFSGF